MVDLRDLLVGDVIRLSDGSTAQVIENPDDGLWVVVRYLTAPDDPSLVGVEDTAFAEAIVALVAA